MSINFFYWLRRIYIKKKEGQKDDEVNLSHFVPWAGIEPALSKELDFESSASTSSATKAYIVKILQK